MAIAQTPEHLPPAGTSLQVPPQPGKWGDLCQPNPLSTHGVNSGGDVLQALAPGDCSLPEEAHVPDGLVLQLWPKQGVGLGQDGNEPAANRPNLPSAPAA